MDFETLTDQEATSSVGSLELFCYELISTSRYYFRNSCSWYWCSFEDDSKSTNGDQLLKIMRGQVGEVSIGIGAELMDNKQIFATPTLSYAGTLVGWGRDAWGDNSWGESPDQVIPAVGLAATASVGAIAPSDVVGVSGKNQLPL